MFPHQDQLVINNQIIYVQQISDKPLFDLEKGENRK